MLLTKQPYSWAPLHQNWPTYFHFAVPEQPTNLQGQSNSPNSIQLTWDPPMDSGTSLESYVLYYNDSHFRQNVRILIEPPVNEYLLQDLTPNTVYHIKVAAKSSRGEGATTPTIQERTLEYGRCSFWYGLQSKMIVFQVYFKSYTGHMMGRCLPACISVVLSKCLWTFRFSLACRGLCSFWTEFVTTKCQDPFATAKLIAMCSVFQWQSKE